MIAGRTGCAQAEGDPFHLAASIARMTAGAPLDDALRAPWLAAIASWLAERAVVSRSALRRAYRDVLRSAGHDVPPTPAFSGLSVVIQRWKPRSAR